MEICKLIFWFPIKYWWHLCPLGSAHKYMIDSSVDTYYILLTYFTVKLQLRMILALSFKVVVVQTLSWRCQYPS